MVEMLHQTNPALSIGLLGGSFNPPHVAHLALARAARQQLQLDRVDLLPAGQPWQKNGTPMPSAAHRLAMCGLLIEGCSNLGVEVCETQRAGNTYTVDTLRELHTAHPQNTYVLILGADQVARLDSWHDWQGVLQRCTLAVAQRAGQPVVFPASVQAFLDGHCMDWHAVNLPPMRTTSTELRRRLAAGESAGDALPPAVARYISEHCLYLNAI